MRRTALASVIVLCALASACGDRTPPAAVPVATQDPPPACCDDEGEPLPNPDAEAARLGVPKSISNDLGMTFVLVPSGVTEVGSPKSEAGRAADENRHEVKIFSGYYFATTAVTVERWSKGPIPLPKDAGPAGRPVTRVTQAEAAAYAAWLSERDPKWSYRLPTEAEWERAARAGSDDAMLPPDGRNAWGVEGLSDGVGEWCRDGYEDYPDWEVVNPWGGEGPGDRVVRGLAVGPAARAAARSHVDPEARRDDVGVRLVARLSYGKSNEGSCTFAIRTVERDEDENVLGVRAGYEVRILSVADRLEARQHGVRPLPWVRIPAVTSPLEIRVPPGRYYAQCQHLEDGKMVRGIEMKLTATAGRQAVDLPVPRPGAILNEPE